MSNALKQAAISEHCRELKMPRISRDYATVVGQATDTGWDYEDFLLHMFELEVHGRRDATSNRRIREARFPEVKTLEQIDWTAMKGVSRTAVMQLTSCEYLDRGDDIVIAGPIGTGKTMLATALAVSKPPSGANASPSCAPPTWYANSSKLAMIDSSVACSAATSASTC